MGKVMVCTMCKSAECDGKEYSVELVDYYDKVFGERIVCSSEVYMKDGKFWHHVVRGHGDTYEAEAKESYPS